MTSRINSPGDGPLALVVDDEPQMRELAMLILNAHGWRVLQAPDGRCALDILQERNDIDVLVTDIHMPVMSGMELVAAVSEFNPTLKTLYITGYADRLFATQSALAPDVAFLEKPFSPAALAEAVTLLVYGSLRPPVPSVPTPAFDNFLGRMRSRLLHLSVHTPTADTRSSRDY